MKTHISICFALGAILSLALPTTSFGQGYRIPSPNNSIYQGTNQNIAQPAIAPSSNYLRPGMTQPNYMANPNGAINTNSTAYRNSSAGGGCDSACGGGCDSAVGGCDSRGGLLGRAGGGGVGSRFGGGCGGGCADACCSCGYFSAFGGWTGFEDVNIGIDVGGVGALGIDLDHNDGWGVGGAIGRRIRPRIRAEFEMAYRNASYESLSGTGLAAGLGAVALDGKTNIYSGMVNLFYDFTAFQVITPYLGVGAGVAFVDSELVEPTTPLSLDLEFSTFAYQGIAGLSTCLSNQVDLFGEFRLFGTDDFRFGLNGFGTTASGDVDLVTQNFFVGFRVKR